MLTAFHLFIMMPIFCETVFVMKVFLNNRQKFSEMGFDDMPTHIQLHMNQLYIVVTENVAIDFLFYLQ